MNLKQIKSAIRSFKNADVSIIKDEALREKARKLQKQKGFTLLELLVVITLLATLATAALVAYEGIGENARDASAATALNTMEGTLRNYRAVEGEYPEQFDNLANVDGVTTDGSGAMKLLASETKAFFGQYSVPATTADSSTADPAFNAVMKALADVGLEEIQSVQGATTWKAGYVPNLAINESYPLVDANPGSEIVIDEDGGYVVTYNDDDINTNGFSNFAISIVPSAWDNNNTPTACNVGNNVNISSSFDGSFQLSELNKRLNLINDGLESDQCNLVVAVGIGKEVPGATQDSRVAIGQVATVGTNNVDPNKHYARAIALFHVGADDSEDGTISADEIFAKARLIGVVDPEGRTIDEVVAAANAAN